MCSHLPYQGTYLWKTRPDYGKKKKKVCVKHKTGKKIYETLKIVKFNNQSWKHLYLNSSRV